MSLIRKVFWPSALALGLLVFLGAVGNSNAVRPAFAADGNICAIYGPDVVAEGSTNLYVAIIEDQVDDDEEFTASIDNTTGNGKITSVLDGDDDLDDYEDGLNSNVVHDIDAFDQSDLDGDITDFLMDEFGFIFGDFCGDSVLDLLIECIDDGACADADGMSSSEKSAFAEAVEEALAEGETDCDELAEVARRAAIGAGASTDEADVADRFLDEDGPLSCDQFLDDIVVIDVTCFAAGEYEVTIASEDEDDDGMTIAVLCLGAPDNTSTISARPATVEISPALGNVSHSLITVELLSDDEPSAPGYEVDFTTDRCSIETAGVDTAEEFLAAEDIFAAYNINVASTAAAIQESAAATAPVDSSRTVDNTISFAADGDTFAAAILGCGPEDTGAVATPGVANITAIIEVSGGADVVLMTTVTVIGPPHTVTVAAAPSTLVCGEKATITATILDSIGQNVSNHTRVEAVTNAGGVLGGTGAVAGLAAPVAPISSTVAETFDGVATFYLLTSEQHSGPYEVVVTTGGSGAVTGSLGGVFSTAPISAQATVACAIPTVAAPHVPAPTIHAPDTGTGSNIKPPRTGSAGLVDAEGSSWLFFVTAGVAAFAVAGLASVKFARR